VHPDYDALLVFEIGDRAASNDRHACGDRRITATEIRRTGQVIDFTLASIPAAPTSTIEMPEA